MTPEINAIMPSVDACGCRDYPAEDFPLIATDIHICGWCGNCFNGAGKVVPRPLVSETGQSDGKCVACAWRGIDCDAVQGAYCARHQE